MREKLARWKREGLTGWIIARLHHVVYGSRRRRYIAKIEARVSGYSRILDSFTEEGASGARRYPWRESDLLKVLDLVRPKRIVELGSGLSTVIFSAWVRETPGASLLSVDHSAEWAELTRRALEEAGLLPHPDIDLRVVPVRESDRGSSYDMTLESGIDLLYVDGPPPVLHRNGRIANQDAVDHFDSGGRPRLIMIDVRLATVEAIRAHPAAADYSFTPGLSWLMRSRRAGVRDLAAFGAWHRHSVFSRKAARAALDADEAPEGEA